MKLWFAIGSTFLLILASQTGCTKNDPNIVTSSSASLVEKIKNCADVNCDADKAESMVGKPADIDSRITDDRVFLLNHEFEITSNQPKLKEGELISNKFEEADVVMIWFCKNGEDQENFGLRWIDGKVEYFEGEFW